MKKSLPVSVSIFVTLLCTQEIRANSHCVRGESVIDRAWIKLVPEAGFELPPDVSLSYETDACWRCGAHQLVDLVVSNYNCTVSIDTRFHVTLQIIHKTNITYDEILWREKVTLTEYSEYQLSMFKDPRTGRPGFIFVTDYIDVNSNIPIYVAIAIYALLAFSFVMLQYLRRWDCFPKITTRYFSTQHTVNNEPMVESDAVTPHEDDEPLLAAGDDKIKPEISERLRSLDAFRGLSLVIMIFVNYGGGGYWFFNHSFWNGLTVADLVFPWFIWIMGASITLSMRSLLKKGATRISLALKIVRRAIILFGLGLILNTIDSGSIDLSSLRIPGVLQRLAISYMMIALVHLITVNITDSYEDTWWSPVRDLFPYWIEWLVMISFLIVHLLLTFFLPLPEGCHRGYLGPGGMHDEGKFWNCTGGAAGHLDQIIFGQNHIYQSPTCQDMYKTTVPYDPEGALGCLTSIFLCFLGLQAGKILVYRDWKQRCQRWILWSIVSGIIAGILCQFDMNDGWIPVNKNLWSVSYVLAMASMAFFSLTIFYIVVDVFKHWNGAPFIFPGMNSILIYVLHELLHDVFPVSWQVPQTHASMLALHLWGASFWTFVAYRLHVKRFYLAV